jgi:hypothetical protein
MLTAWGDAVAGFHGTGDAWFGNQRHGRVTYELAYGVLRSNAYNGCLAARFRLTKRGSSTGWLEEWTEDGVALVGVTGRAVAGRRVRTSFILDSAEPWQDATYTCREWHAD